MQKIIRKFKSFAQAEDSDLEEWINMPSSIKLSILQELREEAIMLFPQHFEQSGADNASGKRLQRVYRIVKRPIR